MKRHLTFSLAVSVTLSTLAIPLRAANKPRAGEMGKATVVWTNQDLERLRSLGLISTVGQPTPVEDAPASPQPSLYAETQDPEWYAKQAAKLRNELERGEARLREYRQAIDDARSLRETTGGINLDEGDVGITPDAGIEILQQQVKQTQMELDGLEDLARRNDIEPGTLRGQ